MNRSAIIEDLKRKPSKKLKRRMSEPKDLETPRLERTRSAPGMLEEPPILKKTSIPPLKASIRSSTVQLAKMDERGAGGGSASVREDKKRQNLFAMKQKVDAQPVLSQEEMQKQLADFMRRTNCDSARTHEFLSHILENYESQREPQEESHAIISDLPSSLSRISKHIDRVDETITQTRDESYFNHVEMTARFDAAVGLLSRKIENGFHTMKEELRQELLEVKTGQQSGFADVKAGIEEVKGITGTILTEGREHHRDLKDRIVEFREAAMDRFADLKRHIQDLARQQQTCLPLDLSSITAALNSFLRCLYFFCIAIINGFLLLKQYYMWLRTQILDAFVYSFSWIPIPNIDKCLTIMFICIESMIWITLIDTIGVFFGYEKVGTKLLMFLGTLLVDSITALLDIIIWAIENNPITKILKKTYEELVKNNLWVKYFDETTTSIKEFFYSLLDIMNWIDGYRKSMGSGWGSWGLRGGSQIEIANLKGGSDYIISMKEINIKNINKMMDIVYRALEHKLSTSELKMLEEHLMQKETKIICEKLLHFFSMFTTLIITGKVKYPSSKKLLTIHRKSNSNSNSKPKTQKRRPNSI